MARKNRCYDIAWATASGAALRLLQDIFRRRSQGLPDLRRQGKDVIGSTSASLCRERLRARSQAMLSCTGLGGGGGFTSCENVGINNVGDMVGDCWNEDYSLNLLVRWSTRNLSFSEVLNFPAVWGFGWGVSDFRIATVTYVSDLDGNCPYDTYASCEVQSSCTEGQDSSSWKAKTLAALARQPPDAGAAFRCTVEGGCAHLLLTGQSVAHNYAPTGSLSVDEQSGSYWLVRWIDTDNRFTALTPFLGRIINAGQLFSAVASPAPNAPTLCSA